MAEFDLAVVIPVYNEEASITAVVEEWQAEFRKLKLNVQFYLINDESKDSTLQKLEVLKQKSPRNIIIHSHKNRGHGQSCIVGYNLALETDTPWVLQIDSDGQCDPQYFSKFWEARNAAPLFGYRRSRGDGLIRWCISRVVSLVTFLGSGVWLKDANVPYRLMPQDLLRKAVPRIPNTFYLANILVAVLLHRLITIHYLDIHFRPRSGGVPSVRLSKFAKLGRELYRDLKHARLD